MASQLTHLENELKRMLVILDQFKDFNGAVDYPALKLLFEGKGEGQELDVAVRDITGHFYRGRVNAVLPDEVAFEVLALDGEFVSGVKAEQIIGVRIQDKG